MTTESSVGSRCGVAGSWVEVRLTAATIQTVTRNIFILNSVADAQGNGTEKRSDNAAQKY